MATFNGEPESFVLAALVGAEGDEDGVCVAGDVESNRQVPAASQCQLGAVVDDEDIRAAVGRPLEGRVCDDAYQQALVALRHEATDALGVGRVVLWVARADDERRTVGDPPNCRADVRRFTSYTQPNTTLHRYQQSTANFFHFITSHTLGPYRHTYCILTKTVDRKKTPLLFLNQETGPQALPTLFFILLLVRPPGTVVPDGLLFYRRVFFL